MLEQELLQTKLHCVFFQNVVINLKSRKREQLLLCDGLDSLHCDLLLLF